ncbi:MAG: hypothetical protein V1798_09570 [Pseudomonadota bacterium]
MKTSKRTFLGILLFLLASAGCSSGDGTSIPGDDLSAKHFISVGQEQITLDCLVGEIPAAPATVTITNPHSEAIDWKISEQLDWVTQIVPNSGSLEGNGSADISIYYSCANETSPAAQKLGLVLFQSADEQISQGLNVTLNPHDPSAQGRAVIEFRAIPRDYRPIPGGWPVDSLELYPPCVAGQAGSNHVAFWIVNSGDAPLNWTASENLEWVTQIVFPTSRTLDPGQASDPIDIYYSCANQTASTTPLAGAIKVTGDNGEDPKDLAVSLLVLSSPTLYPSIPRSPTCYAHSTDTTTIVLRNSDPNARTIAWTTSGVPNWAKLNPAFGSLAAGAYATISVALDCMDFSAAGTQTATITFHDTTTGTTQDLLFSLSVVSVSAGAKMLIEDTGYPSKDLTLTPLNLACTAGQAGAAPFRIMISNDAREGGADLVFSMSTTVQYGNLALNATDGAVSYTVPMQYFTLVDFSYTCTGLTRGQSRTGTITFHDFGNDLDKLVAVTITAS